MSIDSSTIKYSVCNNIEHAYLISNTTKLKITGGPLTNNTCNGVADGVYYNSLNSVESFRKGEGEDEGSYFLKNGANIETISLTAT